MAIAKGTETVLEQVSFNRYIGVAPVKVLAVNPSKAQLEEIYGRTMENDPVYLGEQEVDTKGGKIKVKSIRIDFILQTDEAQCGILTTTKASFFLRDRYNFNGEETKVKVIDKYGRTAWVTLEQARNHEIPMYSNGPAKIDPGYRPAYVGEEELVMFISSLLNIKPVMSYNPSTSSWAMSNEPENSEILLEDISKYFSGNIGEIKDAVSFRPENLVLVLLGVRTTDEGKQYQSVFSDWYDRYSKWGRGNFNMFTKRLAERKANGAYSKHEFEVCPVKVYEMKATNFNEPSASEAVFNTFESSNPFSTPNMASAPVANPFAQTDKSDLPF